ncbi:MAG: RecX family transcriptional regulator [Chlamydiales bacterium]|nr:RecX family transcriptional regulator [Chlamydiales bacterium]
MARRGYFSSELKERLQRKRFSEKAIDRVVYDLIQKGYIDDAGRLEAWISKEFAKGHGSKWIYQAFKKKVGKEEIQRFLPAIQEGEKASLEKYLSRRASQRALKDRKKLIRQLLQRGYSYQTIRSVGLTSFTH